MKIDGYSGDREAHASKVDGQWVLYPFEFAVYFSGYKFADEVPVAVPSFVVPNVDSDDPLVVSASWIAVMTDYFDGDERPYEFELRGFEQPEVEAEVGEGIVY